MPSRTSGERIGVNAEQFSKAISEQFPTTDNRGVAMEVASFASFDLGICLALRHLFLPPDLSALDFFFDTLRSPTLLLFLFFLYPPLQPLRGG